jgi:hypothetical protein
MATIVKNKRCIADSDAKSLTNACNFFNTWAMMGIEGIWNRHVEDGSNPYQCLVYQSESANSKTSSGVGLLPCSQANSLA